MAKQVGILKITGTVCGLTFYKLDGQYYVRQKTSLNRKRVMRDRRFARSRECMSRFGQASQIAGQVYRKLPAREKQPGLFGRMTGRANRMLFAGASPEMVLQELIDAYLPPVAKAERQGCTSKKTSPGFYYGTRETRAPALLLPYPAPGAVSGNFSNFVWARIP